MHYYFLLLKLKERDIQLRRKSNSRWGTPIQNKKYASENEMIRSVKQIESLASVNPFVEEYNSKRGSMSVQHPITLPCHVNISTACSECTDFERKKISGGFYSNYNSEKIPHDTFILRYNYAFNNYLVDYLIDDYICVNLLKYSYCSLDTIYRWDQVKRCIHSPEERSLTCFYHVKAFTVGDVNVTYRDNFFWSTLFHYYFSDTLTADFDHRKSTGSLILY